MENFLPAVNKTYNLVKNIIIEQDQKLSEFKAYNFSKDVLHITLRDYITQPWNVTINNMIKEWPSIYPLPQEALISSGVKVYLVAEIAHFVAPALDINAHELKGDSTYKGQFVQNSVSGTKNLALWYEGVPRGTRKHELDRPFADFVLKGGCKIFLLSQITSAKKHMFMTNMACESLGYSFLIGMENLQNKEISWLNINAWYDEMSHKEYWVDVFRKGFAQTASAWLLMTNIVKPAEHFLGHMLGNIVPESIQTPFTYDWAIKDLPFVRTLTSYISDLPYAKEAISFMTTGVSYIPVVGKYIVKSDVLEIVLVPNIANYAINIATGMAIVPTVRSFTYTINPKLKVLVEYGDNVNCTEIGKILELSKDQNIDITYKYDAYKTKANITHYDSYICKSGKELIVLEEKSTDSANDGIIIHYPREDNFVDQAYNYFAAPLITVTESIAEYTTYCLGLLNHNNTHTEL